VVRPVVVGVVVVVVAVGGCFRGVANLEIKNKQEEQKILIFRPRNLVDDIHFRFRQALAVQVVHRRLVPVERPELDLVVVGFVLLLVMMKCGLSYDPEAAKRGVEETRDKLFHLRDLVLTDAFANPSNESIEQAYKLYQTLPITWQINWAIADINPQDMQEVADAVRNKVNEVLTRKGSNRIPLQRAFNAQ